MSQQGVRMKHAYNSKLLTTTFLISTIATTNAFADSQYQPGIVVSATPLERTTDDLATPITIINRDAVNRSGAATLGGLVGDKPGIAQSSFAPGASRPVIRGLDNTRVRIQENGIGTHDVSAISEDHAVPVNPLSVEKVEVIRGPAVLRYGSSAIGGLVSVLNERIPTKTPEGGLEASALVDHTTVDEGFQGAGNVNFSAGPIVIHADAFAREADDYDTPQGTQLNSAHESVGGSVGASFMHDMGHIGFAISQFDSEYDVPGGEAETNQLFIDLEQTKYTGSAVFEDLEGVISGVKLDAGYTDYTHDEVSRVTGSVGSRFDNEEWEARAELIHAPIGALEGAIGIQLSGQDLSATGEGGELIEPSERDVIAGFFFEEWKASDNLTLQFGGRVEHVTLDGVGVILPTLAGVTLPAGTETGDFGTRRELDFTPLSGSVSAVFGLSEETKLGATVQYVERAPDLLELFAKGPHEATETFEIGNPNLDKEAATSFELTLAQQGSNYGFDIAGFYTSFNDFIFKSNTGFVCGEEFTSCGVDGAPGVEDELTQIAYSQADADFHGFEVSGYWDAFPVAGGTIGFDGQFDYVNAEFSSGGNVPRIPPVRYGLGAYFKDDAFFGRIGFLRAEEQDDVATNETATNGYTDVRAEGSYSFRLPDSNRQIEIGLVGTNLLDDDIRNHVSFKKDDVLLPGASARFFIRARL